MQKSVVVDSTAKKLAFIIQTGALFLLVVFGVLVLEIVTYFFLSLLLDVNPYYYEVLNPMMNVTFFTGLVISFIYGVVLYRRRFRQETEE
ncbi:MAG: hypothetical protein KAW09_01525 [Thermoplasmata archaeon]|nr:hypothetical protein [Thermoplasmata archaeon]